MQDYVNYHSRERIILSFLFSIQRIKVDKSQDFFLIEHSKVALKKSLWPYQCGSARICRWKEICCEGSSGNWEKELFFLITFLHISCHEMAWNILTRKVLYFLVEYLSPWIAMGKRDDPVQHGEMILISDYNSWL